MRVLIADKFEQSGRDGLQALGCEISYQPDVKDETLVEAIKKETPDVQTCRKLKGFPSARARASSVLTTS